MLNATARHERTYQERHDRARKALELVERICRDLKTSDIDELRDLMFTASAKAAGLKRRLEALEAGRTENIHTVWEDEDGWWTSSRTGPWPIFPGLDSPMDCKESFLAGLTSQLYDIYQIEGCYSDGDLIELAGPVKSWNGTELFLEEWLVVDVHVIHESDLEDYNP